LHVDALRSGAFDSGDDLVDLFPPEEAVLAVVRVEGADAKAGVLDAVLVAA
jgi:hypothetical protein